MRSEASFSDHGSTGNTPRPPLARFSISDNLAGLRRAMRQPGKESSQCQWHHQKSVCGLTQTSSSLATESYRLSFTKRHNQNGPARTGLGEMVA